MSEDGVYQTGSLLVQDSTFTNTDTAILSFPLVPEKKMGTTGITLDNVAFSGVGVAIADSAGKTWLAGDVGAVDTYTVVPSFFGGDSDSGSFVQGSTSETTRLRTFTAGDKGLPKAPYFSRGKPLYEGAAIVQMKWHAKGDGFADDTAAFPSVVN